MTGVGLREVAAWDVSLLATGVAHLVAVADRLPSWRTGVETVGAAVGDPLVWSGSAATVARTALAGVAEVAIRVAGALAESAAAARRMVAEAGAAHELAGEALAVASTVPVDLDDAGRAGPLAPAGAGPVGRLGAAVEAAPTVERAQALAAEALAAAARAVAAGVEAGEALRAVGVVDGRAPADFPALAGLTGWGVPPPAPPVPPGLTPEAAARWWAGLSSGERLAVVAADPEGVGGLDGVPAWARDQANRALLERALADPTAPGHPVAVAADAELAARAAAGEEAQLYLFQPEDGLVAVALGDVDTADAVGVLVPGVGNEPDTDLDDLADDAAAVAGTAATAAPGAAVATIAWLGYRTPSLREALGNSAAEVGGRALDTTLRGVAALRADDPARVTVVAHSYGTVVADRAVDRPGELPADALVVLGSPGMDHIALDLEAPEVFAAASPIDPVTWTGWHGLDPTEPGFLATELPTELGQWHGEYYAAEHPTVAAIGEVVAGTGPR
ncbi:alpha/beta hydrolase [Blastococcus sp. SYSU D00820]